MRQLFQSITLPLACTLLWACSAPETKSPVETPSRPESAKTQLLEAGAATLQSKPPIEAINAYLDGFHFYNGHPDVQMEAHHYCSILNEDVIQCVIFDGNTKGAPAITYVGWALFWLLLWDVAATLEAMLVAGYGSELPLMPLMPLTLLCSALVLLISFRNSSAYNRWWEARTLWGSMVNSSRSYGR